jgi:small subunit ribosomal protein S17
MANEVKVKPNETTATRGRRVELVGEVVGSKMQKTISVLVYRTIRHEKYGKFVKLSTILKAHDPSNTCKVGDTVKICESRPISKTKRWSLVEVVTAAK